MILILAALIIAIYRHIQSVLYRPFKMTTDEAVVSMAILFVYLLAVGRTAILFVQNF